MAAVDSVPMSLARYGTTVPVGSSDRIWLGPLKQAHGLEVHTRTEWEALIEVLKTKPVSYDNLRRPTAAHRARR